MIKRQLITGLLLTTLTSGCASIHKGNYAKTSSSTGEKSESVKSQLEVLVSGSENTGLSSKYFTAVDFTFENQTGKWRKLKVKKIDFGNADIDTGMKFPLGKDLQAWSEAAQQNQQIWNYNFSLAMGAMALGGAALAGSSRDSSTQRAGLVAAGAGSASLAAQSINQSLNSIELAKIVPESHLLSGDIIIAPGLHAKRWIAIGTENPLVVPYAKTIYLTLEDERGRTEKLILNFRRSIGMSSFQSGHPDNKPKGGSNIYGTNPPTQKKSNEPTTAQ